MSARVVLSIAALALAACSPQAPERDTFTSKGKLEVLKFPEAAKADFGGFADNEIAVIINPDTGNARMFVNDEDKVKVADDESPSVPIRNANGEQAIQMFTVAKRRGCTSWIDGLGNRVWFPRPPCPR